MGRAERERPVGLQHDRGGALPTAPANRSIHCLYDARSALVGSRLQASAPTARSGTSSSARGRPVAGLGVGDVVVDLRGDLVRGSSARTSGPWPCSRCRRGCPWPSRRRCSRPPTRAPSCPCRHPTGASRTGCRPCARHVRPRTRRRPRGGGRRRPAWPEEPRRGPGSPRGARAVSAWELRCGVCVDVPPARHYTPTGASRQPVRRIFPLRGPVRGPRPGRARPVARGR